MKRFFVLAAIATFSLAMSLAGSGFKPALAEDFTSINGAPKWKLLTYHDVGPNPDMQAAKYANGGGIGFAFLPSPNTSMLVTEHKSYQGSLLGNLTSKTVSAHISIPDAAIGTTFSHYGGGAAPANVRFYFQTAVDPHCRPSGQFVAGSPCESQYWWSNPVHIDLAALALSGPLGTTLSAPLNPSQWSDRDGHIGNSDAAHLVAFAKAVSNVQLIGLSFGGGNNFAFGVGVSSGSATFHLLDFSVTP